MKFVTLLCVFSLMPAAAILAQEAKPVPAPKRVAFVIDDGPVPAHNAAFRELFAREQVRVTFANVGKNVAANPELTKATAAAGHQIINHSYTHPHLNRLPEADIAREAADTSAAIEQATGRAPVWFWAPYLEHDEHVDSAVRKATGLEQFPYPKYHFIVSLDYEATTTADKFIQLCTTGIVDGTIILMHEWPEVTLANLPAVIAELKRQGVTFVTFSELAAGK